MAIKNPWRKEMFEQWNQNYVKREREKRKINEELSKEITRITRHGMGVRELLGRDNIEEESNNLETKCWNGKQMEIRNSIADKEETQLFCFRVIDIICDNLRGTIVDIKNEGHQINYIIVTQMTVFVNNWRR